MNRDITKVRPLSDHRLELTFEGGERRLVKVLEIVPFDGVFADLSNREFFERVRVEPTIGTIVWPNGADLCPDVLYERSVAIEPDSVTSSNLRR